MLIRNLQVFVSTIHYNLFIIDDANYIKHL